MEEEESRLMALDYKAIGFQTQQAFTQKGRLLAKKAKVPEKGKKIRLDCHRIKKSATLEKIGERISAASKNRKNQGD